LKILQLLMTEFEFELLSRVSLLLIKIIAFWLSVKNVLFLWKLWKVHFMILKLFVWFIPFFLHSITFIHEIFFIVMRNVEMGYDICNAEMWRESENVIWSGMWNVIPVYPRNNTVHYCCTMRCWITSHTNQIEAVLNARRSRNQTIRDLENKLDEELSWLTLGRNTPEFSPILTHHVVTRMTLTIALDGLTARAGEVQRWWLLSLEIDSG
jgi:hypothetical protein